jgi:GntR family transcriptional repressor for pyruvate dehydrogenase complex
MDDAETPELAITVSRITAPKASDVLAEALRARIRSGQWPEGVALPSERDLALQARLSRTTVREALRILELDGLIEIRPGRGGGARVRRPAGDELSRQLELFIWGRNISARHLHDVRSALEALGAASAARMRTESDLADLLAKTEAVERSVDNLSAYLDANLAWHMAVVHASHNELLVSFMEVLAQAIHEATELDAFDSVELRTQTLKIHRAILDAIVAGDADAARRRMARHVLAARDVALAPSPPQAAQVTPARAGKSPACRPAASTPKGRARSRAKPSARKGAK